MTARLQRFVIVIDIAGYDRKFTEVLVVILTYVNDANFRCDKLDSQ